MHLERRPIFRSAYPGVKGGRASDRSSPTQWEARPGGGVIVRHSPVVRNAMVMWAGRRGRREGQPGAAPFGGTTDGVIAQCMGSDACVASCCAGS